MSELLLAASMAVRLARAALNAALDADGATKAQLLALRGTPPADRRLTLVADDAPAGAPDTLSLWLLDGGIDLRVADPLPGHAVLRGSTASLLRLLRAPHTLQGHADVRAEGDLAFAEAALATLAQLRPDPLLPLIDLVGPRLPSALHTLRAGVGGVVGNVLKGLSALVPGANAAPGAEPPPSHDPNRGAG